MTIMNRHRSSRNVGRRAYVLMFASTLGIGVVVAGCGAAPDPSGRGEDREPTARAASALGESTCASASYDVDIPGVDGEATSPDGNYDHPDCRNAFIAVGYATATYNTHYAAAEWISSNVTTPQYLGCNAMWIQMTLYKWNGGQYVKVNGGTAYGYEEHTNGDDYCIPPFAEVKTPGNGVYKIVAAAGIIYTTEPITVGFSDDET